MLEFLSPASAEETLPRAGDPDAARIGVARWDEAAGESDDSTLASFMRALAADGRGRQLLGTIFGNSPFLTHCCLREPDFVRRLLTQGPDATFAELLGALNDHLAAAVPTPALMTELRTARRRAALAIAVGDIAANWPLEQVTGSLSALAEAALDRAVHHLLSQAVAAGDLAAGAETAGSGLIVLGMGKLGGRELNYSSDIDLLLLYDGERVRYTGSRDIQAFFTRLGQELVRLMAERTADGYVFRTDLRLRPDPGSTPLVLSVEAALAYYESAGQNWERAALIKARPVAGDRTAGSLFIDALRPFLWRKHLDFAAIEDIHSIKRQINAHRGGKKIAVAGHNIKLGRGGIREIEFFAQTQQLIWGGRLPAVRESATCSALTTLAQAGRISTEAAQELIAAYHFLRRVEHRLQMVDDAQTHSLPADKEGLRRIAVFLGFDSADGFTAELTLQLLIVESHYARLFEAAPSLSGPGNLVFTGTEDDPETLATLSRLGFGEPATVTALIRGWHHGRYAATRSQRARELLTDLVPGLLKCVAERPHPDAVFLRFDRFLSRLPAGVQILSLFLNNPPLLDLVVDIMGAGPRLADELARRPGLLDAVLAGGFFDALPELEALAEDLKRLLEGARHYEDVLTLARRWVGDRKFQISVQLLQGQLDGDGAGAGFADVAEAVIAALLPRVTREFEIQHGVVPGGALIVLGLGKLGSRELTVTSDLDLILIYDAPENVETSDGARPLPVPTYYARLSQRFIKALTVPTAEGPLYEVDMRLRPSGTSGPLASSLEAFRKYHDGMAWTWEHMALTRARMIAGDAVLGRAAMATIRATLTSPRDHDRLCVDVAEMRRRIAEQHPNPAPFDVKHRAGGMIDIEFIAQYLQLRDGARAPDILHPGTAAALAAAADAESLPAAAAATLIAALRLWRNVQGMVKLAVVEPFDETAAPPALLQLLARAAGAVDFAGLAADMEAAADRGRALFETMIGHPAALVEASNEDGTADPSRPPEGAAP